MIAEGRRTHPAMALYLWLAAITGARRGELCALQVCDVDLENGVLHLAHNYWATHKASDLAAAAGVKLNIKGLRHYTASQLLAARFDLRNTAARLGHGSGGATTLRHYADPVSEVDRRAAAYLAQLTAGSADGEN